MSEIDTIIGGSIGVAGALMAAVLVHFLDERRETRRIREDTSLRSLGERQSALREAYNSLVELVYVCGLNWHGTESGATKIGEAADRFDICVFKAMIWMSSSNLRKLHNGQTVLWDLTLRMIRGTAQVETDRKQLAAGFAEAAMAIAGDLHTEILDTQLQEIAQYFSARISRADSY